MQAALVATNHVHRRCQIAKLPDRKGGATAPASVVVSAKADSQVAAVLSQFHLLDDSRTVTLRCQCV